MKAKKTYPANIDWRVPPGQMLAAYLEDRQKTTGDLAQYLGVTVEYAEDLLTSKIPMTMNHAEILADFLQMPDYYWPNSVRKYEEFLAKKKNE